VPGLYRFNRDAKRASLVREIEFVNNQIGAMVSELTSQKLLSEHGGFSRDDTNVMMLLSNPDFGASTETIPVETAQIAPTILTALHLNPNKLQAVQMEGTAVLPGLDL